LGMTVQQSNERGWFDWHQLRLEENLDRNYLQLRCNLIWKY
jgi:hypothetical protein